MRPIFSILLLILCVSTPIFLADSRANAAELSSKDRIIYQQAFAAVEDERWSEARRIASAASNKLLAKVILWLDLTRPGPGRSFNEMTKFLAENPDWPKRQTLTAQAERAMPGSMSAKDVLAWFSGRDPLTADGAIRLLGALLEGKQTTLAEKVAETAWIERDFDREQEAEFKRRFGHLLKQEADLARLDRLLWDGQSDQAVWMLDRVDDGHKALARARMKLAASTPDVESAVAAVPASLLKDPGLVYERARWNRRRGNDERALQLLSPPPGKSRDPDTMWGELERAGRYALDQKQYKTAYRIVASHGAETGEAFAEAEFLSGWIALRYLKDPKTAVKHFIALHDGSKSPISRGRGAYWAGSAFEEMKDPAQSQAWYSKSAKNILTYYGQLAAEKVHGFKPTSLPATPKPSKDEIAAFEKKELVRIVRALIELDEEEWAKPFLIHMVDISQSAAERRLIGDLALATDRKDYGVAVGKAARPLGHEMTDPLFPLAKVSMNALPEPAFILGVIRQESAFDVAAVSPAGALGLMQLMPSTAKAMAKQAGLGYSQDQLSRDGGYNITLGRAYLQKLLDTFNGSYILSLAAYNAGPNRVLEWIRRNGDPRSSKVDVVDWIERIPFDETRNYVQRVMENVQIYRARLKDDIIQPTLSKDLRRADANY